MYESSTCIPSPHDWGRLLRESHPLHFVEQKLGQLRCEIRTLLLQAAREYTHPLLESLNVETPSSVEDPEYIVATGHQAELFHSGIFQKYALLNYFLKTQSVPGRSSLAGGSVAGVSVVLDLDPTEGVQLKLPFRESSEVLQLKKFALSSSELLPIAQRTNCFSIAELDQEHLALTEKEKKRAAKWLKNYEQCRGDSVVPALSRARFAYHREGVSYLDLPFSSLISLQPAQSFFRLLVERFEPLVELYNRELERHRSERKIRNSANPFPNLLIEDGWYELPFWSYDPERHKVFARRKGKDIVLRVGERELGLKELSLEANRDARLFPLVPRGALVSLFFRVLCFDLFIHGVGGARYDSYTDRLIAGWFHLKPPAFVTVTADRYLFEEERTHFFRLEDQVQKLSELYNRPEGARKSLSGDERLHFEQLLATRQQLIDRLKQAEGIDRQAPGKELARITGEIKQRIDKTLGGSAKSEYASLQQDKSLLFYREFPYFLFEFEPGVSR